MNNSGMDDDLSEQIYDDGDDTNKNKYEMPK